MILPPLFVNFTQHIMTAKEKLLKNNAAGARISDDGFPLGRQVFCFLASNSKTVKLVTCKCILGKLLAFV